MSDKGSAASAETGRVAVRSTQLPAHQRAQRLGFLDTLRGLAALAVFGEHAGLLLSTRFATFDTRYLEVGQCGVTVFFLCSGFIIPASLERHGGLRSFWISRVFRLYPLYWCSLAGALALAILKRYPLPSLFATAPRVAIAANLTMMQAFAGIPNAVGPSWSLAFEMLFYLVLSALFLVRLHTRTVAVTAALLVASILVGGLYPLALRLSSPSALLSALFYLATLFAGTVVYRWYSRTISGRAVAVIGGLILLTLTLLLLGSGLGPADAALHGRSVFPFVTAWIAAYLAFGLAFLLRGRTFPRATTYLGTISYSLYLLHPLVLAAIPRATHAAVMGLLWLLVVLALSAATFRWIETPAIALGRRVSACLAQQLSGSDGTGDEHEGSRRGGTRLSPMPADADVRRRYDGRHG